MVCVCFLFLLLLLSQDSWFDALDKAIEASHRRATERAKAKAQAVAAGKLNAHAAKKLDM